MHLTHHSQDLRKLVKSLKDSNPEEFKSVTQSERYNNNVLLSSQEKLAVERVFSARVVGKKTDDKIKMTYWI